MLIVIAASSTTMKIEQSDTTVNSSLMLPIMAMNCCWNSFSVNVSVG
jgi:hypothetical protein